MTKHFMILLVACTSVAAAKDPKPSGELGAMLAAHNDLRAQHCAPPLSWSNELARRARAWAERLEKKGCVLEHSEGHRFGENLAAGTPGLLDGTKVVSGWYREISDYDFSRGTFSMQTGHFTQVVWLATERIGCGIGKCRDLEVWVCNYDPPGNIYGQYDKNVLPRSCAKKKKR